MVPLERVSGLLRCPNCRATGLRISGDCLECPKCGLRLPIGGGCIDLLGSRPERVSFAQKLFFSPYKTIDTFLANLARAAAGS